MYYIISLSHTSKSDEHITFWRPDNAGYTYFLAASGKYETLHAGYHDNDSNVPVPTGIIDRLAVSGQVLNSKENWNTLWLVTGRKDLLEISKTIFS